MATYVTHEELAATTGGSLVGTPEGMVQEALDARPTSEALALPAGSEAIGFLQAGAGATPTTLFEVAQRDRNLIDFMTPEQRASYDGGTVAIDMSSAVQRLIDSFPLNTGDVGILSPKGFANGGCAYIPRGRFRLNQKIILRRGINIRGESREGTQFISFIAGGSVFQYADAGRYLQDEITFSNFSIWQDGSVPATAGAAIDIAQGPASVDSINFRIENFIIEGTYRGIRFGAAVASSISNGLIFKTVSDGIASDPTITSTSVRIDTVYCSVAGGYGFNLDGCAYCELAATASDTNALGGYRFRNCNTVVYSAIGAEHNAGPALTGEICPSISGSLYAIENAGSALKITNCKQVILVGGSLNASSGVALDHVVPGGNVTFMGVQLLGSYAANITNSPYKFLNLTGVGGLVGGNGNANNWGIGNVQQPDPTATLNVGGLAGSTAYRGLYVNPVFTAVAGAQATAAFLQSIVATDVTLPLVTGSQIANAALNGTGAATRTAGLYIHEQTRGTTANANLMIDTAIGTVPAGNWNIYSASTRDSVFVGPLRMGSGVGPLWLTGAGVPQGVVTAPVGSMYTRTDGGDNTTLYIKESGTGNLGWVAK